MSSYHEPAVITDRDQLYPPGLQADSYVPISSTLQPTRGYIPVDPKRPLPWKKVVFPYIQPIPFLQGITHEEINKLSYLDDETFELLNDTIREDKDARYRLYREACGPFIRSAPNRGSDPREFLELY
ncbi:hypothetical protein M422DRAFT_277282 [Sphaerobolus stellatus SS14]|uniref:Uncharacterized protein n=1 Tax=Sphaerobolus stellatus (strain SS14) TaxID=990650 RepID=A0A0C9UB33_SPHS4|nr:hypothetical protein M422DRAFT_277282 [Sphaerobolus stellatus SS14]